MRNNIITMAGKGGLPSALRSLQPYLTIYKQFINRDPIVSYYAAMHFVREGISIGKDTESKTFLLVLMNDLDAMKSSIGHEAAITSEQKGKDYLESVGVKLFGYADEEDRSGRFHKNMVKAFFTSFHIFSIMKGLGDLSDEIESKQKYAKWKAVEIDRCLKNGIPPTPGSPRETEDSFADDVEINITEDSSVSEIRQPSPKPTPKPRHNPPPTDYQPPTDYHPVYPPPPAASQPYITPSSIQPSHVDEPSATIGPEDISEAQKKCKFASSALDYDDVTGAIEYLTDALRLLRKQ